LLRVRDEVFDRRHTGQQTPMRMDAQRDDGHAVIVSLRLPRAPAATCPMIEIIVC
jgi:hypothetical protein